MAGASRATLREPARAGTLRPARRAGLLRSIMENVEALAIAIVMALILKYFLIEAYKIPTGSMQPQIMGDPPTGVFDRVLVNKLVYLLRGPERFEVVVFRNPLWQRQNYIKRLVGFGGERVTIRNGDLFITPKGAGPEQEKIARKPDSVWHAVRKDLLPERHGVVDLTQHFETQGSATIDSRGVVLKPAAGETASIKTRAGIRDHYLDGYHPKWVEAYQDPATAAGGHGSFANVVGNDVTDVEFAADVTPEAGATAFFVEIREAGRTHRLELAIGTGKSTLETDSGPNSFLVEKEAPVATLPLLPVGTTTRVSLRNVDDELVIELDDRVVLRRPYVTRGVDFEADPNTQKGFTTSVTAGARGGIVGLTDLGLWRDIHYLADGNWSHGARSAVYTVPDGEFMVLGDNTQNSWDCRQWEEGTVTLADGRTISGNYFSPFQHTSDSNPDSVGGTVHFRNVYGQEHVFPRASIKGDFETTSIHSFPERMLLGKALAVFWPLPPFSPTWRLKWVR